MKKIPFSAGLEDIITAINELIEAHNTKEIEDFEHLQEALREASRATGGKLNIYEE